LESYPEVPWFKVADDKAGFCKKDALYFSCHKFVGGPQTPGILVAKKKLFDLSAPPVFPGGGTVLFVTETEHHYLKVRARKGAVGKFFTPPLGMKYLSG
jgi:selenocysteine lyase/cysteine desulfurase